MSSEIPAALDQDPSVRLAAGSWAAPGTVLTGDISIGRGSSIWYGSILRADGAPITISTGSNIQDGCILHTDPDRPIHIGSGVSVGHRAVIHGCTIENDVLVGMGAIVMNGAHIGFESIVGAGALVLEGHTFPPRSLVVGSPARVVRDTSGEDCRHIRDNARDYVQLMEKHRRAVGTTVDLPSRNPLGS